MLLKRGHLPPSLLRIHQIMSLVDLFWQAAWWVPLGQRHASSVFYLFPTNMGITRNTTSIAAKTNRVRIILNLDFTWIAPLRIRLVLFNSAPHGVMRGEEISRETWAGLQVRQLSVSWFSLLLFLFFAEDLQHESFSGSVSKYGGRNNCHPDESNYQPSEPWNKKRQGNRNNSYDESKNPLSSSNIHHSDQEPHFIPPYPNRPWNVWRVPTKFLLRLRVVFRFNTPHLNEADTI